MTARRAQSTQESLKTGATVFRWLRVPRHERQLTDCLGQLASVDTAVARGMTVALLEAVSERGDVDGRAAHLLEKLPQELVLTCSREDPTGDVVTRERTRLRAQQTMRGSIDWVFHPKGQASNRRTFQLAVEVKIDSPFGHQQLIRYHKALEERRTGPRGLLALALNMPARGLLDPDKFPHWLGVVLWEELFPRLRGITADDPDLASQWPLLLDVLQEREDVGTEPVTWQSISRASSSELHRLLYHVRPGVQARILIPLARRPTAYAAPEALASVEVSRGALNVRVPAPRSSPAVVAIRLAAVPEGLELKARVWVRRRPKLVGKQKYDAIIKTLTGAGRVRLNPPYVEVRNGRFERRVLLRKSPIDVRIMVEKAIADEIASLARSRALDADLARA